MKTYSTYKNSGVEWLGEIPKHWEISKFKRIFFEKKKTTNVELNCGSISYGKVVYKNDESVPVATKKSYQVVSKGDFLVNPLNLNYDLVSLRIALSEIDVVVSSGYIVLNTNLPINKAYYKWLLHIFDIAFMKTLGSGVRQTLSYTHIANCELVFPPLEEQTAIAQFLEDKTTKIEQAITIKQQQIELLKERRQILIHKAVTRGLNDKVKLKDSGVEWIAEIPEHWEVKKLTWLTSLITQGGNPNYELGKVSEKYRVLKTKSLYNDIIHYQEADKISKQTYKLEKKSWLQNGDLLVAIVGKGSIGKVNVFSTNEDVKYIYSRSLGCIRFNDTVNSYFVKYLFQTDKGQEIINLDIKGSTGQEVLQTTFFKNLKIQLPPITEQNQIVEFIETATTKIATAISLKEQEIEKLKEYKMSLIDGVVTGKMKVC